MMGEIEVQPTLLYNLLMTSGPAQTQSQMFHFHLTTGLSNFLT